MNLQELLKKRMIERFEPDERAAQGLLETARSNILAAEDNLKTKHPDWALAIAYNSMLSAGRALMFSKGYRPFSDSHHLAIVQFCAAIVPADSSALVTSFNRYRVRRHDVIYGEADSVGEDEARRAVENAKKFLEKAKQLCKR